MSRENTASTKALSSRTKAAITLGAIAAGGGLAWVARPVRPLDSVMHLGGLVRRSANPDLVYELRPRLRVIYQDVLLETNARGFRDRDWPTAKPARTRRIVFVGDSLPFGPGVEVERTYPRLVDELLRSHSSERIETLEFAVPGYNAHQNAALVRDVAVAFAPDVLVLGYVGNDDQIPNFVELLGAQDALVRRDALLGDPRPLTREEKRRWKAEHADDLVPAATPEVYRRMAGPSAVDEAIRTVGALGHEHGFRTLLTLYELEAGPAHEPSPTAARHAEMARLASNCGIETLDLVPEIGRVARERGWTDSVPLRLSESNAHLNPEAHRWLAGVIASRLASLGWVEPAGSK